MSIKYECIGMHAHIFPSCNINTALCICASHSVVSNSLRPHGLYSLPGSSWNSPGKNTGVGCHSLLQGTFQTQVSNPDLLHCRQILYHPSHQGSQYSTMPKAVNKLVLYGHNQRNANAEICVATVRRAVPILMKLFLLLCTTSVKSSLQPGVLSPIKPI